MRFITARFSFGVSRRKYGRLEMPMPCSSERVALIFRRNLFRKKQARLVRDDAPQSLSVDLHGHFLSVESAAETAALSLSVKSVFVMLTQPRGRAHSKAFAAQTHPNRGRVPRFGYFKREKVSVWELSDVRVLRSSKHRLSEKRSFSTVSVPPKRRHCTVSFYLSASRS